MDRFREEAFYKERCEENYNYHAGAQRPVADRRFCLNDIFIFIFISNTFLFITSTRKEVDVDEIVVPQMKIKNLKNFIKKQDYESLTKHLKESGELFEDDFFPANISVLTDNVGSESYIVKPFGQKPAGGIKWLRPHVSLFVIVNTNVSFLFVFLQRKLQKR